MKPNKQEKVIAEWQKTKKKGIVKHTLIAGGVFALVFNILTVDLDKLYLFTDTVFLLKFIGEFLLSASLFGVASWWIAKWQYNKAVKKQESIQ